MWCKSCNQNHQVSNILPPLIYCLCNPWMISEHSHLSWDWNSCCKSDCWFVLCTRDDNKQPQRENGHQISPLWAPIFWHKIPNVYDYPQLRYYYSSLILNFQFGHQHLPFRYYEELMISLMGLQTWHFVLIASVPKKFSNQLDIPSDSFRSQLDWSLTDQNKNTLSTES